MGIFEQLYNGEIFIAENSTPKTEEYKNASHRLSEASGALADLLDEKQTALLEAYLAARADVEMLVQINVFRQGARFGFQLKSELAEEKTDTDDRLVSDKDGFYLSVAGDAWNRTIETVKFYLALQRAGFPVYIHEAESLAARLDETEKIGIVPDGVMPAYCQSWFPNEHIIDYMNLPTEETAELLSFCVWQPVTQVRFLTNESK